MSATIKKVDSNDSPKGDLGQIYLVEGKSMSMRMWREQPADGPDQPMHSRDYEQVGYVIGGKATLKIEGQTITLEKGDSWLVPAGVEHQYVIEEPFTAVEACSPPAREKGRDAAK